MQPPETKAHSSCVDQHRDPLREEQLDAVPVRVRVFELCVGSCREPLGCPAFAWRQQRRRSPFFFLLLLILILLLMLML